MSRGEAFRILEIEETNDKKEIKRAYAGLVRQYHPEEYPEKWQEIHEAYETALKGMDFAQFSVHTDHENEIKTGVAISKPAVPNSLADEEKEIDHIFDNIDRLMQEKREQGKAQQEKAIEESIQKLQELNTISPKERKNRTIRKKWKNILVGGFIYIVLFAYLIGTYGGRVRKEKESVTITGPAIHSYEDLKEISNKEKNNWYREFYLPTLARQENEELQRDALDDSICLQEGLYLTASYGNMQEEADAYAVREGEVPKQLKSFVGEGVWGCRVKAFCITTRDEAKCTALWCDLEKLGFGDTVRIFYYNENKREYVEMKLFGEKEFSRKYNYEILGYRVFSVDPHVHEEGEACRYPIVFIGKTDKHKKLYSYSDRAGNKSDHNIFADFYNLRKMQSPSNSIFNS